MAKTSVKNQVCQACGADIRSQALFCYNCGGAVAKKESSNNRKKRGKSSRETVVEEKGKKSKVENDLNNFPAEIKKDEQNESLTPTEDNSETNGKKEVKLKSAAALRNKARSFEPKKVEIIWEEHENAPNIWFILVAVLLVIFSVVIYFIATSLK